MRGGVMFSDVLGYTALNAIMLLVFALIGEYTISLLNLLGIRISYEAVIPMTLCVIIAVDCALMSRFMRSTVK